MPMSNRRILFTPKHFSSLQAAYEKIDTRALSPASLIWRLTTANLHLPKTGNVHPLTASVYKSTASAERRRAKDPKRKGESCLLVPAICISMIFYSAGERTDCRKARKQTLTIPCMTTSTSTGKKHGSTEKQKNGATNAAPRPLLVTRTQLTPLTRRSDVFKSIKTQLRLHIYTEKMITTSFT